MPTTLPGQQVTQNAPALPGTQPGANAPSDNTAKMLAIWNQATQLQQDLVFAKASMDELIATLQAHPEFGLWKAANDQAPTAP